MLRKAQTFLGYVVLTVIIVAAFYAMSVFLRGVFGGRYKSTADTIGSGEQFDIHNMDNYSDDQIEVINR